MGYRSHYNLPKFCVSALYSELISEQSPTSPLSLSSGSNGSCSNMQGYVPPSDTATQPAKPTVLDGIRSNYSSQPTIPPGPTYTDDLKFGLENHDSHHQPLVEPKYST